MSRDGAQSQPGSGSPEPALRDAAAALAGAVSPAPAPTPTPAPPTPLALAAAQTAGSTGRRDCEAVRGSEYHSEAERTWYLATCLQEPSAPITVRAIGTGLCRSGLSFRLNAAPPVDPAVVGRVFCLEQPNPFAGERFSIGMPFACPIEKVASVVRTQLAVDRQLVALDEVVCRP